MQLTGAFLAIDAEIVDSMLNVTGGVIDWIGVPAPGSVNEAGDQLVGLAKLVVLMQAGPDDHSRSYRMKTEMVMSTGESVVVAEDEIPAGAHSGENRFWIVSLGIALGEGSTGGRMVLIQSIEGGGQVSVPVELRIVD